MNLAAFTHVPDFARRLKSVVLAMLLVVGGMAIPRAAALDPGRALTQYGSQNWGMEQGLPCNAVLGVLQGSDGYLWLGTEEGLVRFDGVRTRVFNHKTDPDLAGNTIYSAVQDPCHSDQLLLTGSSRVCRFADGRIRLVQPAASAANFTGGILCPDQSSDGSFWIRSVDGIFHMNSGGEVAGPFGVAAGWPAEKVRAVCRDKSGTLWVATGMGLYRQRGDENKTGWHFDPVPGFTDKAVEFLAAARGGGIWIGSRDAGSGHLGEDGILRPRAALAGCIVSALLEDRNGMLWVGTRGSGLFRLPANDDVGDRSDTVALTTANGLIHNLVTSLCEDLEGDLWIGTKGGLQVLRDVRFLNYGRPEGLTGDDVHTVYEDRRGSLWMGHENGLSRLDPADGKVTNYLPPPSSLRPGNNRVLAVESGDEEGETLLVGTGTGLLCWKNEHLEALVLRDDLDRSVVLALCRDGEGGYWVGTENGLYRIHRENVLAHFTHSDGLASNGIRALRLDRRGNLWIGSGSGLSCRKPDGKIVNLLKGGSERNDDTVNAFFDDPAHPDELFVGTKNGLWRARTGNINDLRIARYTTREGLFDDLIWTVLGDARGNVWLSSNQGICRLARSDLDRFDRGEITSLPYVAYGVADGLRSREANGGVQHAGWRDRRGRLWFAMVKGAAVVDPARIDPNPLAPPVHIEELLADGRLVPKARENAQAGVALTELAPGTQKLGFQFTAVSLVNPTANRFRYRLDGFDNKWTDAGAERVAQYTNLPPGRYRFDVQAANSDGVWNLSGATFAFHLRPFFYQTGWFQCLVGMVAIALLWAGQYRFRSRWQKRLARTEAELRARARTEEILRQAKEEAEGAYRAAEYARTEAETAKEEAERADAAKSLFLSRMSHELRTPLNAILGFGQLLEIDQLSESQSASVEHILTGGRRLLSLVDEILDLTRVGKGEAPLRSDTVEIAPLLTEISGMIVPLARENGVTVHLDPSVSTVTTTLFADRQRLKQVLLHLLTNAVIYNRPGRGEVILGVQEISAPASGDPRQRIFVRDTGPGIGPADLDKLFIPFERLGAAYGPIRGTGLGLTVSKQLAHAMGGTIGVESALDIGSTFWVDLPVARGPVTMPELPSSPNLFASAELVSEVLSPTILNS